MVGIFLLIVLAVFAGPNALPRLLSSIVPNADEGVPCVWLPQIDNNGRHQSLVGRLASEGESPLTIRVDPGTLPNNAEQVMTVRIVLTNQTVGTVGVVVLPEGDVSSLGDNRPGIGVAFNPNQGVPPAQGIPAPDDIRQLGPRQSCVTRIEYTFNELSQAGINPSSVPIQSPTAIYPDYGLWTGVITSDVQSLRFVSDTP
jgi:hypothetical protein